MDEKQEVAQGSAPPSYQTLENQDLGYQENPGYGNTVPPPQLPSYPTFTYPTAEKSGNYANVRPGLTPVGGINHRVAVVQTGAIPVVIDGTVPRDYCVLAWFACLCCCLPLGVLAIIYSNKTNYAIRHGDLASAFYFSKNARTFSILSIVFGFFAIITTVLILVL